MTRLLLFGGSGQVGSTVKATAPARFEVVAPSSADVSLSDAAAIRACIDRVAPAIVVNAAAFTRVDDAEVEQALAHAVNAAAPTAMAHAAQHQGARLVHLSTDYVFDGTGSPPYRADAPTSPVNAYGSTKLAGEQGVREADPSAVIVRTAWVHAGHGTNFVGTAVRLLARGTPMRVVDDQVGTPTHARTLADAIFRIIDRPDVSGVHHVTDAGVASWYDVACCVRDTLAEAAMLPASSGVLPVDSAAFPRPARRPQVSILDTHATRAALDWTPPHWRVGVVASTLEWARSLSHA